MSYLDNIFVKNIAKNNINVIFELGSRDLLDARKLQNYYNSSVYSFECNPNTVMNTNLNLLKLQKYKKYKNSLFTELNPAKRIIQNISADKNYKDMILSVMHD